MVVIRRAHRLGPSRCKRLAFTARRRATKHNWFVVNDGTPQPSIVLGVSGWVARGHSCSLHR